MKYYFNSLEQIQGDEAYNEHNFEQALVHYKKALFLLNQTAAQRNFKPSLHFYDALAYVLSEVIVTKADFIKASLDSPLNYRHTEGLWREIPGLLQEMRTVYEKIRSYEPKETKIEKINITYKAMANCCEAISDALIDSVDEDGNGRRAFEQITSALKWLKQAINHRQNANLPIKVETHVGYLNLLERAYKCHQEKRFLTQITAYIQENNLMEYELHPEEELEILSYQLLVAIENKDEKSAAQYAMRCRELMEHSEGIDQDSLIIEDIKRLIAKLPNSSQETKHRRLRRIILDESDEESELMEMNVSTSPTRVESEGMTERNSAPISSDMDIEEDHPSVMNQQSSGHATSSVAFFATSTQVLPQPAIFSVSDALRFFPSLAALGQSTAPAVNHADVFVKIMKEVAHRYNNHKFLANILSLIGDFYYKSSSLFPKNCPHPLMTFGIYEAVMRLDAQHPVAPLRLHEIYNRSTSTRGMIDDHRRYNRATNNSGSTQSIFNDAIEENMIQVETFLSTNSKKREDAVNGLLHFVANKIVEHNIAGSKSQLIAGELRTRYQELTHTQEPTMTMSLW